MQPLCGRPFKALMPRQRLNRFGLEYWKWKEVRGPFVRTPGAERSAFTVDSWELLNHGPTLARNVYTSG
jgi:hypothetical protein